MTVEQLIEHLAILDPQLPVYIVRHGVEIELSGKPGEHIIRATKWFDLPERVVISG